MSDVHFCNADKVNPADGIKVFAMQGAVAALVAAIEKGSFIFNTPYLVRSLIYHVKEQLLSDDAPSEDIKGKSFYEEK
jgi:hypothetical protein